VAAAATARRRRTRVAAHVEGGPLRGVVLAVLVGAALLGGRDRRLGHARQQHQRLGRRLGRERGQRHAAVLLGRVEGVVGVVVLVLVVVVVAGVARGLLLLPGAAGVGTVAGVGVGLVVLG
jgi:hypothetical protein